MRRIHRERRGARFRFSLSLALSFVFFFAGFFFNDDVNDDDESLFVVSSDLNRIGFPDDHRIVQFC